MANWGSRVLGCLAIVLFLSSAGVSNSSVYIRFSPNDYSTLPEVRHIDSLIATYHYDDAVVAISGILASEGKNAPANKLIIPYGRLGFVAYANGYYDSAQIYYDKARQVILANEGEQSLSYARWLINTGLIQESLSDYAKAGEYYSQANNLLEKSYPDETLLRIAAILRMSQITIHNGNIDSTFNLQQQAWNFIKTDTSLPPYIHFEYEYLHGDMNFLDSQYDSSSACFSRAAEIAKAHSWQIALASTYRDWSYLNDSFQKSPIADSLSKLDVELIEKYLRPNHPVLAKALNNRAEILEAMNQPDKCLSLLDRSEDIILNTFGQKHDNYANILSTKAKCYLGMRDFDNAIKYNEKYSSLVKELYGENSLLYNSAIGNRATIYLTLYDYEHALPLLHEYCDYYRVNAGEKSLDYLSAVGYLAYTYYIAGQFEPADSIYSEILPSLEETYGNQTTKVGEIYLYKGMCQYSKGEFRAARQSYLHTLSIYEQNMVAYNPLIAGVDVHVAIVDAVLGDYDESLSYYRKVLTNRYKFLSLVTPYASIDQKIRYMTSHPILMHSLYTMAMKSKRQDATQFAFEMLVRGKALSLDAVASQNRLTHCTDDSVSRHLYDELQANADEIANLTFALQDAEQLKEYRPVIDSLFDAKEVLESKLSSRCEVSAQKVLQRTYALQEILDHLPANSVLLDFAEYDPYDFEGRDAIYNLFEKSHYLVFVLEKSGRLSLFDLGTKAEIDSLISESRNLLEQVPSNIYGEQGKMAEEVFDRNSATLFASLIAPYYDNIKSTKHLFISGDGVLNLLPFETLIMPNGHYLLEEHEISYLSSTRDLIQFGTDDNVRPQSMVLFFDPDYNSSTTAPAKFTIHNYNQDLWSSDEYTLTFLRSGTDCIKQPFLRLAGTQKEADEIINNISQEMTQGMYQYTGSEATEGAVKHPDHNVDIYHFATHGFVCPDLDVQDKFSVQSLFLQSGLAMAGANNRFDSTGADKSSTDDGILTALEISGLDFDDVNLVTLSACETGLGESIAGEGVFGLRRAFQQAGAKTLLMSLRKIPDEQCSDLMAGFYKTWLIDGVSKSEALRQATLYLLNASRDKYGNGHPFFWAGFILLGNPN